MSSKTRLILINILLVIFIAIFILSAYSIYQYFVEYKALDETYSDAQDFVQIEVPGTSNTGSATNTVPTESTNTTQPTYPTPPTDPISPTIPEPTEPQTEPTIPPVSYDYLKIDINVDWEKLAEKSKDAVGWLYIPGTNINYPLVYKNNEYYLSHDYTGKMNSGGAIFLDESTPMGSKNTIIYGHNMSADIMFHRLRNYKNQKYADEHKYIYIVTKDEIKVYQVFSVVYADKSSDTYTRFFGINGSPTFMEYVDNAIKNSMITSDVREIVDDDYIIALSTCTGRVKSERLVVHAVLLTTY